MRVLLLIIGISLFAPLAVAQDDKADPLSQMLDPSAEAPTLNSPRATMDAFLKAMYRLRWGTSAEWEAATRCLDMSNVDSDDAQNLAEDLYAVLNRIERIDVDTLPGATDPSVQADKPFTYFPQPRGARSEGQQRILDEIGSPAGRIIIAPNANGQWLFSAQTMEDLPTLYRQMQSLPTVAGRQIVTPTRWIEARLPAFLIEERVLNVKYWQWLALLLVILLGLSIDLVVRFLLRLLARRLAGKEFVQDDEEGLRKSLRPIGLLAAAAFWMMTLYIVGLEGTAVDVLEGALNVFAVLAGVVSAWRLTDLTAALLIFKAASTKTRFDDVLIPLLRKTAKIFIFVIGLIYGASALNIPIVPLLTSLGIGGVAFAFAAKDTVENFFGSIAVLLDRPFDVGDWVVVDSHEGIIEEVGFRSTRIRTFYNSQITMPNSNLVRAVVDNYGRRTYRRWRTMLGVQYDTTPDQLIAFTEGIRELIRTHPYTRKDYYQVYCNEFADSSLNILLYMFFEVPDWNTELRERDRLFVDIVRLADQLGVSFAFPTQTLHLHQEQPGDAEVRHEPPRMMTERRARVRGIRAAQKLIDQQPWVAQKPGPVVITGTRTDVAYDDAGNPIEEDEDSPNEGGRKPD